MINIGYTKKYCKDYKNIENYDKAINDTTQVWDCHHRLEIDEGLSLYELKNKNLYFNRPAYELIFLTKAEHMRLHMLNIRDETRKKLSDSKKNGFIPWTKGLTKETDERVAKISDTLKGRHPSEETRKKESESKRGENNPMFGVPPKNKGKHKVWDNKELNKFHYE